MVDDGTVVDDGVVVVAERVVGLVEEEEDITEEHMREILEGEPEHWET